MLEPVLTFDSASHTYRFGGTVVPGVTSLLQSLHSFANVPLDVLEEAQHRGSNVHTMTHLIDIDDLDDARLKDELPEVRAYMPAYLRFLSDCTPNYIAIEVPVYHRNLRYAGTPDRIGEFSYQGARIKGAVIDIKTSVASHPCWGLQCAAYAQAAGIPAARRFSLQLRNDGSYRLLEWTSHDDWPAFVSLITLNTWKARNRL